jgi:two-component system, OmpR family, response regulator
MESDAPPASAAENGDEPTDKTILIVDDDPKLRHHVSQYLNDNDFNVYVAENGVAMDRIMARHHVDLVILDLAMPGEDGLSICRRLDRQSGPGIIMASAAGEETDRVLGLELGADDYLPKPFSPRELLARVRAVLRRRANIPQGGPKRGEVYGFGGFRYDPARRQLLSPASAMVLLTSGEASVLSAMLAKPRTPMSRDELSALEGQGGRAVDIVVSRLRKKLEAHGGADLIRTHRGLGYIFDSVVTRE